jgi:peptide deformylase
LVRKIRVFGDPVLREKAASVGAPDADVRALAADLLETLAFADGVGLAAPQIGVSRRVIAVHPPREDGSAEREEPRVYVDPEIVEKGGGEETAEEGCLSIPGVYEMVKRSRRVLVRARDVEGHEVEVRAEGIVARILQHEIDHLDGVLFVDRVGPMRRALLKRRLRELQE